ncbi:hypothetical protein ACSFB8_07145 [Enterococcus faecalis]
MKHFRYALASISYHKYVTLFTLCFFSTFAFVLMSLTNLCRIETKFLRQLAKIPNSTAQIGYHRQMLTYYQNYSLWLILFFSISFSLFWLWYLFYKKNELKVLHLTGFSKVGIVKQCFYEIVTPAVIACGAVLLAVLLFQNTYNYLLLQARLCLAHSIQIPEASFSILNDSTANFTDVVPSKSVVTIKKLDLFTLDEHTLTLASSFKDWLISSGLLLLLTLALLLVITCCYLALQKKKWSLCYEITKS